MRASFRVTVACLVSAFLLRVLSPATADDGGLRERIKDENGARTDVWVYNDIPSAMAQAKKENKPLFVTFRCVPCKACAAFDADVASGNERVREFARKNFIPVRQVEMKDVDLSLFEFDHDLNWAAMFVNADGVVYARYGTQSAEGPDAYNSIDGLLTTMQRVLKLHAAYPGNIDELRGKHGSKQPGLTALDLPGMRNAEKLEQETTRSNCVHCHMIHDAGHFQAQEAGTFSKDQLWKFPLPDTVGLKIDRNDGLKISEVVAGSPAAAAGLKSGSEVRKLNGQRIVSIADMQWVLHKLPNTATSLNIELADETKHSVKLPAAWKEYDISWRGSMWSVSPRLRVWSPILAFDRRKELGIPDSDTALEVKWINRDADGGRAAIESGLRQNDVIVAVAGQPLRDVNNQQFNAHIKLNYKVGDELPLTVLRDGQRKELRIRLVE
ncbi:PDZ domain-containing protein [bacterium]|nr:PDZ domain-containing protein [bacterium]